MVGTARCELGFTLFDELCYKSVKGMKGRQGELG